MESLDTAMETISFFLINLEIIDDITIEEYWSLFQFLLGLDPWFKHWYIHYLIGQKYRIHKFSNQPKYRFMNSIDIFVLV